MTLACACGKGEATAPSTAPTGNFTLRTVGGARLPAIVFKDADGEIALTAGTINLSADKTWTSSLTYTFTAGGTSLTDTSLARGTFTQNGSAVVIHDVEDGSDLTATLSGNTLTALMDFGTGTSLAAVFQR